MIIKTFVDLKIEIRELLEVFYFQIKVAIRVIVLVSLIILIVVLSKTCKKQQGKYEVEQ